MKNILILILLTKCFISFSQETIILKDGREYKTNIVRINKDSVFFYQNKMVIGSPVGIIEKIKTFNKFKKYLIDNPETINTDKLNLGYTNYCLNNYRKESNIGRSLIISGLIVQTFSPLIKIEGARKITQLGSGIMIIIGFFTEWNSLHWLKNLSVLPEYKVGLGYTFTF